MILTYSHNFTMKLFDRIFIILVFIIINMFISMNKNYLLNNNNNNKKRYYES
mgnify:FL=1